MTHTVLVTGGSKRVGRALCLSFAKAGWSVAVHYNDSHEQAAALVAELQAMGVKACAVHADLFEENDVLSLLPAVQKQLGRIDLLINNASIFQYDSAATASRLSWDRHMAINLRAPFVLSQQFVQQTSTGLIINMLDARVRNLTPNYTSYTVSKMGLWTLTQTMAMALGPHIRVNAIGPGVVFPEGEEGHHEGLCQLSPLQKPAEADDICRAAHFLWDAKSMTGEMIAVDCGMQLGWTFPRETHST